MSSIQDMLGPEDVEPLEDQRKRRLQQAAQSREESTSTAQRLPQPQSQFLPQQPQQQLYEQQIPSRPSRSEADSSPLSYTFVGASGAGDNDAVDRFGSSSSGGLAQGSITSSGRPTFRGVESEVRLTPVTGRVSRAKKGQPVHVCEICDPPRIFTRAEHLRRHTLGHDKPKYPCRYPECEKSFHRADLLARHQSRHDAGEMAYKGNSRSRSGSDSSHSRTPCFSVDGAPLTEHYGIGTAT